MLPLKKVDTLFLIKDYYIGGQLQMKGYSKSDTKDIFEGKVSWFYANGNTQITRTYINGKMEGEVISYFEDGTLKSKGTVLNNAYYNGTFPYTAGNTFKVVTYSNGSVVERLSFYKDTKTIAERQLVRHYDQVQKSIFYDKKAHQIASVDYKNRSGNYLEPKVGTIIHFSYTNDLFAKRVVAKTLVSVEGNSKKEVSYNTSNTIIAKGIRQNGYPFEGSFLKDGNIINYENGKRNGATTCCLDRLIKVSGTYKNNHKYSGTFYDFRKREVSSYKDGTLHGTTQVFDENNKVISLKTYKNGSLDGVFISQNEFNKQLIYKGVYKNGSPVNGDFFEFGSLKNYENGKLKTETNYDYTSYAPNETIIYNTKGNTTKKIFYKNGKAYTLLYKDGIPHSGIEIQSFGFVTYNDGAYNGPFVIYDKHQTIKGNYKNFNYHGEVLFIQKGTLDTLKCTFDNKKPIDGIDCFNGRISYRNGKKHGLYAKSFNNRTYSHDSLAVYYTNDTRVDTIKYFMKKKLVHYGIYKNGKPFHGTFFNDSKPVNFEIYENGTLTKKEVKDYYNKYRHQRLYVKGRLAQENVYYLDYKTQDSLLYQLALKDEKPFLGEQFEKDATSGHYTITNFLKGKKEGIQTIYKKLHMPFIKQFNYKNNKLNGKATFNNLKNKDPITGVYENDIPVQGSFVRAYRSFLEILKYKKSTLQKKTFYTYSKYYDKQNFIDSIIYKKGKPYNGLDISMANRKLFAKAYKNGILQNTHLSPSLNPFRSYRYIIHETFKDSLIGDGKYKYAINYKNKKKTSGAVTYYYNSTSYGTVVFKNNTITSVNIGEYNSLKKQKYLFDLYVDPEGNLINIFKVNEFEIKRNVPKLILGDKHSALGSLERFQLNYPKAKFSFYIDGKYYSTIEMRDTKPYNGIMFEPDFTDTTIYNYREFKDGKSIVNLKGLTKAALLQKLNTK